MTRFTRILALALTLVLAVGATAAPAYAYTDGYILHHEAQTTYEDVVKTYNLANFSSGIKPGNANYYADPHKAWDAFVTTRENNNWFDANISIASLGEQPDYTCYPLTKYVPDYDPVDGDQPTHYPEYYDICRADFDYKAVEKDGWTWSTQYNYWYTEAYYKCVSETNKLGHPTLFCNLDNPVAWNKDVSKPANFDNKRTTSLDMYKGDYSAETKALIQTWWDTLDAYIAEQNGSAPATPVETETPTPTPMPSIDEMYSNSNPKYEASNWARATIVAAIDLGIYDLDYVYADTDLTDECRRYDFCGYIGNLFVALGKKDILDSAIDWDNNPFEDLYRYEPDIPHCSYINALYHLGIINGTSENTVDPYGTLTREQAATILIRTADVLGINTPDSDIPFTDGISSWAVNGVRRAYGAKLMNGYSATQFGAHDAYTAEQAIITVYRLYNYANSNG